MDMQKLLISVCFVLFRELVMLIAGRRTLEQVLVSVDEQELRIDRREYTVLREVVDAEESDRYDRQHSEMQRNFERASRDTLGEVEVETSTPILRALNRGRKYNHDHAAPYSFRSTGSEMAKYGGEECRVHFAGLPNERRFGAYSPAGEWRTHKRLNQAARWATIGQ